VPGGTVGGKATVDIQLVVFNADGTRHCTAVAMLTGALLDMVAKAAKAAKPTV
jgi:hypothetical protein